VLASGKETPEHYVADCLGVPALDWPCFPHADHTATFLIREADSVTD
jgi:hypothetical protein